MCFTIKQSITRGNQTPTRITTAKATMLQQGYCFIFRATIISICEAYARSRIAPINIPHAGEKRGQKNQSNTRSSLRFRRNINGGYPRTIRNLALRRRGNRFAFNHCSTHSSGCEPRRKKRIISAFKFGSKNRSLAPNYSETLKNLDREEDFCQN